MTTTPDPGPTTRDIEQGIRRELATIRRHWPHTFDPPTSGGVSAHAVPDSKLPGNDTAISLRAEVTKDLAFWVRQLLAEWPVALAPTTSRRVPVPTLTVTTSWVTIEEPGTLDCSSTPDMCDWLTRHAKTISGWEWGNRLWWELTTLAREVRDLAAPPVKDTMPIGECDTCATVVRAKVDDPGNIKCRGCGTTDTIDGWIIRIVGNEPLVTAEQLIPILRKRMGIVVARGTIRSWVSRGVIHQDSVDARGRGLFDRKAVFHALARWEARKDEPA